MTLRPGGRGGDVSAELRRRVMRAVRAEPKRADRPDARRTLVEVPSSRPPTAGFLALVGVLGVLGVLGLLAAGGPVQPMPEGTALRVIRASVGLARLRISGGRGELVVTHLPSPPPGRIYQLWLQRGARTPSPSTLFTVTPRGTADLALPGHLAGVTRVLVTIEPGGGSPAPTTRAVIVASLV